MKRPINQTLIIHSAQLAPGWSTDVAKSDHSVPEFSCLGVINLTEGIPLLQVGIAVD